MPPFAAIGIGRGQDLVGGWVLNGFNGFNGDLTIFAPGAMSRRTIRACYAHLFDDHGLIRVTARTRRDNAPMRAVIERLGFKFESLQRRYFGPHRRHDAFTFVLFRDAALNWMRK